MSSPTDVAANIFTHGGQASESANSVKMVRISGGENSDTHGTMEFCTGHTYGNVGGRSAPIVDTGNSENPYSDVEALDSLSVGANK